MKKRTVLLIATGVLTAAICLIMNMVYIPQIESAAQGLRCFDMRFGYSVEEAREFLNALTQEGRNTYLTRQLPLDCVYPLVYASFFALLFKALYGKKTALVFLPLLLAVADYVENVSVLLMLRHNPVYLNDIQVTIASYATIIKTAMMYLCFILILILLIMYLVRRNKKAKR
ncbi:MAG: hypothetical protein IJK89_03535 [Clostridia bacterium]|nr:hypothetical protein [Clostridia bacterium]